MFVNWIKNELEEKNIKAKIFKVEEFDDNFGYDLFIIGTPIYYEKPLKSIQDFIEKNKQKLNNKNVAIFIVCMARLFGRIAEEHIKNFYLYPLESKINDNLLINSAVFEGWLRVPDTNERKKVKEWIDKLVDKMEE